MSTKALVVATVVLALNHASAQAKIILDVSATPPPTVQVSGTANQGGTFYVTNAFVQPAGSGVIDTFLRMQQTGSEQGYNPSSGTPLDVKPPSGPGDHTRPLRLSEVPLVLIGGSLYREFGLDVNQVGNGLISLNQVQIFQSAAPLGPANSDFTLQEAGVSGDAVISFNTGSPTSVFAMNTRFNNGGNFDANNEVWIDTGKGSGTGDMFFYVANSRFDNSAPNSYITLFSQFGSPSGSNESNSGFEEWFIREGVPIPPTPVPEPSTIAMALTSFGLFGIMGLRRLRSRAHARA